MNADKLIHQELMNALKKAELPTVFIFCGGNSKRYF